MATTRRKYNLMAVIRALEGDERADIGLERELSAEMAKRRGKGADHGGIILPDAEVCRAANVQGIQTFGTPDYSAVEGALGNSVAGSGHNVIATDLRYDLFIEALTARTVFGRAGVTVLDGLVGDIAIPRGGDVSAEWLTVENGEAGKKNPTIGQVTATPHTLAAYTEISRKLMVQTGGAAEALVVGVLMNAIARGVEAAGFSGTGSSGQPLGIEGTSGVQVLDGITPGAVTKADLVAFWSAMETENANTDAAKFIMSPAAKGLLCRTIDLTLVKNVEGTENVGGVTAAHYLCENGRAEDYPVLTSNLCHAKKMYFADWAQLVVCAWSGTEILVDRYSHSITGATRVVAFNDVDFVVRQPKAFVIGTALS